MTYKINLNLADKSKYEKIEVNKKANSMSKSNLGISLQLMKFGLDMKRQKLRRQNPNIDEAKIEEPKKEKKGPILLGRRNYCNMMNWAGVEVATQIMIFTQKNCQIDTYNRQLLSILINWGSCSLK